MSRYKAVLFDLDGTLLNSLDDLANSMNTVLAKMGFATHETEAYKYFVGEGVEKLALRALPESNRDEDTVLQCVSAMKDEYGQHWADHTRPYPGIPELLTALTERGVRKAILTNKPHDFTCILVERLLSSWNFDAVLGADKDFPKKPDPTGAIHVAEKLAIATDAFLYVGDSGVDMKTATAAGMYAVGALWGFRTAPELLENGAAALIKKPVDLLNYL